MGVEGRGGRVALDEPYGQGRRVVRAGTIRRRELEAQVVAREVVEVVKGMLGEANEVLGLLLLQVVGLDGDAQREDGTASLETGPTGQESALARAPQVN